MALCAALPMTVAAQDDQTQGEGTPIVPEPKISKTVVDGDSVLFMQMNNVYV